MRALHRIAAAMAASAALAACDVTLPWSSKPNASGGGTSSNASFDVAPASLSFTATVGGATPAPQSIILTETGVLYLSVSHTGAVAAAVVDTTTGNVRVSVGAPTTVGTTSGSVVIHAYLDSAGTQELPGSPKSVSVTYTVAPSTAPAISVATSSLQFSGVAGRAAPASQTFGVSITNGPVTLQVVPSGPAVASATILSQTATSATVQVTPPAPGTLVSLLTGSVQVRGCVDQACTQQVSGSPQAVQVSYSVTASQLAVAPTTLSFTAIAGAGPSPAQTLNVSDPNGTAPWSASVSYVGGTSGWLAVSPPSGTDLPATPSVTVSFPATTAAGTYSATLAVTSLGATRTVSVTVTVSSPGVLASATSLSFAAVRDQVPLPASQPLDLTTENGGSLDYTTLVTYGAGATGGLVVPGSGTAPGTLAPGVPTDGLSPGHYTATLQIAPTNGAVAALVSVAYDVSAPALSVAPTTLAFTVTPTTTVPETAQRLSLGDAGTPLTWTATQSQPWLQVSPASGSTPAFPTVSLVPSQLETLAPGAQSATVTFTYDAAPGTTVPVTVPVELTLNLPIIDTVMPRVSVTGIGGEVVLRGRGFPAVLPSGALFGTAAAQSTTPLSATELRSVPPASLTAGSYLVTLANALGLSRSTATLEVMDVTTRTAASVASSGAKVRIAYDDVRGALYVANGGAGRIDRHRASAGWVKASDGSDEIPLSGIKNIALSPDGATLLAVAGTTFRLVDVPTFALRATQPTAVAPSSAAVGLEMTNSAHAVYIAEDGLWNKPGVFDLITGAAGDASLAPLFYDGVIAGSANGENVALFGFGSLPPEGIYDFDAGSSTMVTTNSSVDGQFGALDRTAARFIAFGTYNSALQRFESRYFWNWVLVGDNGTLPPRYVGTPPNKALPATLAVALSPLGRSRAYTWDGTAVRCFNLDGTPDATFGVYPLLFSVTPTAAPGANAQLALAADERTAFLAGDANVVVVPLP
jgi:hypothetical protein